MKRLHEISTMRQKPMVKIHQANESSQLTLGLWLGEVPNGLDFLWEGGDTIAADVVAKEIEVRYTEEALVGVDDDAVF